MEQDQQVRAFLFVAWVSRRGGGSFPGFPVVRNALDLGVEMYCVHCFIVGNECEGCLVKNVFLGPYQLVNGTG